MIIGRDYGPYYNTLGAAYYQEGKFSKAIETFQRSMELQAGGNSWDWFFLAMAHAKLGDLEKAREWQRKALEWMDENRADHPELIRFRAEARELLGDVPSGSEAQAKGHRSP